MPFSKLLMPIILQYFSSRSSNSALSSQAQLINAVTETVKKEMSGFILKIASGLVLVGVLIYSLLVLGQHFQAYLLLYNRGTYYSVLFFTFLSMICVFTMYKLFNQKKIQPDPFALLLSKGEKSFNVRNIYENFLQGLTDGLHNGRESEKVSNFKIEQPSLKFKETTH